MKNWRRWLKNIINNKYRMIIMWFILIIICQIRNINMAYIRGRLNIQIETNHRSKVSPRGLNMGRTSSVVKVAGGVMPAGNDPSGKLAVDFGNPGSPKGPYPSNIEAKKKMFKDEMNEMHEHMVTHAIQKETEEWDEGIDAAAKGGQAPGGKIAAPPPFPPEIEAAEAAAKGGPAPSPKPPPPPKGPDAPLSNPFKKNTPKEVDPDELPHPPGKEPKKPKKKPPPAPPGAPKKKDKEEKEKEEKDQKDIVAEAAEVAKEDAEKKKKNDFIKELEEEKKKKETKNDVDISALEKKVKDIDVQITNGNKKFQEIAKLKKEKTIVETEIKEAKRAKSSIENNNEDDDEPDDDTVENADKKKSKSDKNDASKAAFKPVGTNKKSPSKNHPNNSNNHRTDDEKIDPYNPNLEKRKKPKEGLNDESDEEVAENAMKAVDDAVGSEGTAALFTKDGADASKPDGMFEPTGADKPAYWDLSKYDDYDMINIPPKKKIRILYQQNHDSQHPCAIQASSCSLPLKDQLDEEAVACTGIHKNGTVAQEWEERCVIQPRNFDHDMTEH